MIERSTDSLVAEFVYFRRTLPEHCRVSTMDGSMGRLASMCQLRTLYSWAERLQASAIDRQAVQANLGKNAITFSGRFEAEHSNPGSSEFLVIVDTFDRAYFFKLIMP